MYVLMLLSWCLPQHLVQWDAGNPECLLQLVKELIQQYHHYQCQRLRESSRLLFEYDSLLEDPNYGHNMEVYAGRKNSWVGDCFMTLWSSTFWKTKSHMMVSKILHRKFYTELRGSVLKGLDGGRWYEQGSTLPMLLFIIYKSNFVLRGNFHRINMQ